MHVVPVGGELPEQFMGLLTARDGDEARAFAAAHPEVHHPLGVAHLFRLAAQTGDEAEATKYRSLAQVLCGTNWPRGPELVSRLVDGLADLSASSAGADASALAGAVSLIRPVIEDVAAGVVHRPVLARLLQHIASMLLDVYNASAQRAVLDESIAVLRVAVIALPQDSPERAAAMDHLGGALIELYQATGDQADLDAATSTCRAVLATMTEADPERARVLNRLGLGLFKLYEVTGERAVLDEAIAAQGAGLASRPEAGSERSILLSNLGDALNELYRLTGDRQVFDEAIDANRAAVAMFPPDDARRDKVLNSLANRLGELYVMSGERAVLDEAIVTQHAAVSAVAPSSVDRSFLLNNLAILLGRRHALTGERAALDEAIEAQRAAVAAAPETSPIRPRLLGTLANRLQDLYMATGERAALDEAVDTQRAAVDSTPPADPNRLMLMSNLARSLGRLYRVTGDPGTLEEAIDLQRGVVAATPITNPNRPARLHSLAVRLSSRYHLTRERAVLDEAIAAQRAAVAATPDSSPARAVMLTQLTLHLATRYDLTGERAVLDEAIATQRAALSATSPDATGDRAERLAALAGCLADLYELTGEPAVLNEAASCVDDWESLGLGDEGSEVHTKVRLTRARVARLRGRNDAAATELRKALAAFDDELARLGSDVIRKRDIAGQWNGILGELVVTQVQNDAVDEALALIEGDRMWLPAPTSLPNDDGAPPVPVTWIAACDWAVAVISTTDYLTFTANLLDMKADELSVPATEALDAARGHDVRARRTAFDALVTVTSRVAAAFPRTDRLLVVPLGVCALLPFNAATSPEGGHLIDHTTLSIAPSLAWARAATRPRPLGASIGVFDPGGEHPLDLDEDRRNFERLVSPETLPSPSAEAVLTNLRNDTPIVHFSCHGAHDTVKPFASALHLASPLTLQAVLDHSHAPWLANLSACETAIPDLRAVEQLISFPTGFLLGGAAHVLATLWPVGNTYATHVNELVYRHLANGSHPADALRRALRATKARPPLRAPAVPAADDQSVPVPADHPYWWAPFTHHGSPW